MISSLPKISIITPSYNQGKFIEQNIVSVMNQHYPSIEHIIVDGGSTDETVSIIKQYEHLKWVSERDNGQADALNKGLCMATGEIIGWINSDDYYEDDIFKLVAATFDESHAEWLIGDLVYDYSEISLKIQAIQSEITYERLLRDPDIVRQQPAFFKRQALVEVGGWDSTLHMVMDYDLWIRLAKRTKPVMLKKIFSYFRIHDDQKTSYKNITRQMKEIIKIMHRENASYIHIARMIIKKMWYLYKLIIKNSLIRSGLLNKKYSSRPLRMKN